ncbi:MAG: radical SAM/SPASM domain-containing protein [Vitreimonas sp.]
MSVSKLWVWMDASSTCNLACRDCYTKESHIPHLMSLRDFRLILQKLALPGVSVERFHLNWRGEPMTNKRLPEFLTIRRELLPGTPLEFHTNGLLLRAENSIDLLSRTLPGDRIYVSIDGGGPEAHEANRGAGTWLPTMQGLRALLHARDHLAGACADIGIFEITYGRTKYDNELLALGRHSDVWTRVHPMGKNGEEVTFDDGLVPAGPCFWAGNALCITTTGDAFVCLLSFNPMGRLGNIIDEDLSVLLEQAKAFREQIVRRGRRDVSHCQRCRKTEGDIDAEAAYS